MSITLQIGNCIRERITEIVQPIFTNLGITFNSDDIVNDFARFNVQGLEATFYIKGIENVIRKDFNTQVVLIKNSNPFLEELKVKFKRPDKEVRFYIKVKNENS